MLIANLAAQVFVMRKLRAMDGENRSVDCTPRDFLASWGRGDAGPVPCGTCSACCYYPAS